MSWDNVLNQSHPKALLRNILERDRAAHAYLFSGPEGAGMDALAMELAKTVNCERSTVEACDQCESCEKARHLQHPNIHLIFSLPVGKGEKSGDPPLAKLSDEDVAAVREQVERKAKNPYHQIVIPRAGMIKINSIREIRRETAYRSAAAGKKVFVILDAEKMNDESANALLKTLEEPPSRTMLILTTTQPGQLLPTLLSRCQHIRLSQLTGEEIRNRLFQKEGITADEAELVANLSRGSYTRALQLLQSDYRKGYDDIITYLRYALKPGKAELMQLLERLTAENERLEIIEALHYLEDWFRGAMVFRHEPRIATAPLNQSVEKFVSRYPDIDYTRIERAITEAISLIDRNVYIPIVLLNLSFVLEREILKQTKSQAVE